MDVLHDAPRPPLAGFFLDLLQGLAAVGQVAGQQIIPGQQRRAHILQLKFAAVKVFHQAPVDELQHLIVVVAFFQAALGQPQRYQPLGTGAQHGPGVLFQPRGHRGVLPRPVAEILAAVHEGRLAAGDGKGRQLQLVPGDLFFCVRQYVQQVGDAPVGQADVQIDLPALGPPLRLRVGVGLPVLTQNVVPALALGGIEGQ